MEVLSSIGGTPFKESSKKAIRLILMGCTNRPFFHISVQEESKTKDEPVIEQIGNYDPLPNKYNEKLVAINFQRLEYWLRKNAKPTKAVEKLLGLCGYFPVHPTSFEDAYFRRKRIIQELEKLKIEAAKFSSAIDKKTAVSSSDESGVNEVLEKEESESSSMPDDDTLKK